MKEIKVKIKKVSGFRFQVLFLVLVSVFSVCSLLLFTDTIWASDGWEASITVSVLDAENKLSFGQKSDATDDFDNQYDVPAMLSGDIKVYFMSGDTSCWRDIKAHNIRGKEKSWNMHIESSHIGEVIKIKWNPELLPRTRTLKLIDHKTGIVVDMKEHNHYLYKNDGERQIGIRVK
ncbi:MAG: hypothetical protein HY754_06860 [Nitrospirae bacterium]|nr:hypothetical protein [Nitrospirota bacterium]